jgi:hypothetical protein
MWATVELHGVWLRAGLPGDRGSIPGRGKRIFPLASVSRPALGPTQPPVRWVPRFLSPGVKRGRDVTLTAHPHLMPRSRMSRSYNSSPPKRLRGVSWDSFSFSTEIQFHAVGRNRSECVITSRHCQSCFFENKSDTCEISSSHCDEYEAQSLLGCTAVFLIGCQPTFQRSVLPPSSGRS